LSGTGDLVGCRDLVGRGKQFLVVTLEVAEEPGIGILADWLAGQLAGEHSAVRDWGRGAARAERFSVLTQQAFKSKSMPPMR